MVNSRKQLDDLKPEVVFGGVLGFGHQAVVQEAKKEVEEDRGAGNQEEGKRLLELSGPGGMTGEKENRESARADQGETDETRYACQVTNQSSHGELSFHHNPHSCFAGTCASRLLALFGEEAQD